MMQVSSSTIIQALVIYMYFYAILSVFPSPCFIQLVYCYWRKQERYNYDLWKICSVSTIFLQCKGIFHLHAYKMHWRQAVKALDKKYNKYSFMQFIISSLTNLAIFLL